MEIRKTRVLRLLLCLPLAACALTAREGRAQVCTLPDVPDATITTTDARGHVVLRTNFGLWHADADVTIRIPNRIDACHREIVFRHGRLQVEYRTVTTSKYLVPFYLVLGDSIGGCGA